MARTAIAATAVGAAGVDPGGVAVAAELTDGNSFTWTRSRHLYVVNGDATPLTVTVQTPGTVGGQALAVADAEFTVPAGGDLLLPELGPEFRRPDGSVWIDYAGADASVTVAVLDL
ncbi:hypothetical protein [Streptomyces sp. NPDC050164]|uniref:hypothetical protein n=1 Tax=Streptomyces sp. NPDC050164 TaxID=3365605 RepID=UPI0037BD4D33